jgi:hypothetical protein
VTRCLVCLKIISSAGLKRYFGLIFSASGQWFGTLIDLYGGLRSLIRFEIIRDGFILDVGGSLFRTMMCIFVSLHFDFPCMM